MYCKYATIDFDSLDTIDCQLKLMQDNSTYGKCVCPTSMDCCKKFEPETQESHIERLEKIIKLNKRSIKLLCKRIYNLEEKMHKRDLEYDNHTHHVIISGKIFNRGTPDITSRPKW